MNRKLVVASESWPLKQAFRIARGTKTEAVVVVATIGEGDSPASANACLTRATANPCKA